jgi:radical SAM superfamily enzyme
LAIICNDSLIAPEWAANRFLAPDAIYRLLQQQGGQGSALTE